MTKELITPAMVLEVIKILWTLSMVGFTFGGWIFWKLWKRVEDNLYDICKQQRECREELPIRYVNRKDYDQRMREWSADREALWDVLNSHHHDAEGGVVRGRK